MYYYLLDEADDILATSTCHTVMILAVCYLICIICFVYLEIALEQIINLSDWLANYNAKTIDKSRNMSERIRSILENNQQSFTGQLTSNYEEIEKQFNNIQEELKNFDRPDDSFRSQIEPLDAQTATTSFIDNPSHSDASSRKNTFNELKKKAEKLSEDIAKGTQLSTEMINETISEIEEIESTLKNVQRNDKSFQEIISTALNKIKTEEKNFSNTQGSNTDIQNNDVIMELETSAEQCIQTLNHMEQIIKWFEKLKNKTNRLPQSTPPKSKKASFFLFGSIFIVKS